MYCINKCCAFIRVQVVHAIAHFPLLLLIPVPNSNQTGSAKAKARWNASSYHFGIIPKQASDDLTLPIVPTYLTLPTLTFLRSRAPTPTCPMQNVMRPAPVHPEGKRKRRERQRQKKEKKKLPRKPRSPSQSKMVVFLVITGSFNNPPSPKVLVRHGPKSFPKFLKIPVPH
jgi:hypothetical protein